MSAHSIIEAVNEFANGFDCILTCVEHSSPENEGDQRCYEMIKVLVH